MIIPRTIERDGRAPTHSLEGAALAVGGSLTPALMKAELLVPFLLAAAISIYAVRRAVRIAGSTTRA